jgi:hypothetical protein
VDSLVAVNTLGILTAPGTLTISAAPDKIVLAGLNTSDDWNTAGGALGVYISTPQNQSVNFFKGPYQLAGVLTPGSVSLSAATITLSNPVIAGQKTFYRLAGTAADGRPTSELFSGQIVI